METMLFPFEAVEPKSRIVCYGFGIVGRQYWIQLDRSNYCDVVLWVDRAWNELQNDLVDIYPVEDLLDLDDDKYDYVVIAIENESLSLGIKDYLRNNGIKESKIISAPKRFIKDSKFEEIFDYQSSKLNKYIDDTWFFWNKTVCHADKYLPQIKELFLKGEDEDNLLGYIKNKLLNVEAGYEKLIILRYLYDLELFDSDCMKMFQDTLLKMEWRDDTPFYSVIDTSHMIHYGIATKCIYPGFYTDRRKLLIKTCEEYNLHETYKKRKIVKSRDIKRIAVFGFRLDYSRMDPATALVVKYTQDLIDEGYEAKIFITNLVREIKGADSCLKKKYNLTTSTQKEADDIDKTYEIFFTEETSIKSQLQVFIDQVFSYNPDLILDMSDDFCPQTYILNKSFPILCFPMRVGMSSSFFDYIFEMDEGDFRQKNAKFHAVDEDQSLSLKLANMLDLDETTEYHRKDFKIPKDSFVVVSVGGRLNYEMDDELIQGMCSLLEQNDNIAWVLVGDEVFSDSVSFNNLKNRHQIINFGWEEHIEAFYKICDVYLEPRRSGGSHGMRLAMRTGLPVIISDTPSDNRCLFDSNRLCHTVGEMILQIEKMYIDSNYRDETSELSASIIRELTKDSDSKKLIDAYKKACDTRQ